MHSRPNSVNRGPLLSHGNPQTHDMVYNSAVAAAAAAAEGCGDGWTMTCYELAAVNNAATFACGDRLKIRKRLFIVTVRWRQDILKEFLELHTCFLHSSLRPNALALRAENQHFNCTNSSLQLHKSIQNCTFCVELHALQKASVEPYRPYVCQPATQRKHSLRVFGNHARWTSSSVIETFVIYFIL